MGNQQLVRISLASHKLLKKLVKLEGSSMPTVLDSALEQYRRQKFLEEANAAYRALKKKGRVWRDEKAERAAWVGTLADGIEPE